MKIILAFLFFITSLSNAQTGNSKQDTLLNHIRAELAGQTGSFAVAFKNVATGEMVLLNEHEIFHAASTMKTPVMIEVFKQAASGKIKLTDSVLIKNEFKSIVDGSLYQLNPADDSQQNLYQYIGKKIPLNDLIYQMIINSSNLATNLVIEITGADHITQSMHELGAMDMHILRGVEDQKAFDHGLNNTTTAFDLMQIYDKMARAEIIGSEACTTMFRILVDQTHNTIIPALLPHEVKVAHKTGSITGVAHDSGIVLLPDGRKYVLVLLSKNLSNPPSAEAAMARVSRLFYQYIISN